jgi:hypothetical protein
MTILGGMIARAPAGLALAGITLSWCEAPALAAADLRQPRTAGPLTVYPDDVRGNVFYYPPGELAIAVRDDGAPAVHLLHARYTGSAATGDRGRAVVRSILTLRVVMAGPRPPQLAEARRALAAAGHATIELRPLPIRRLESAIVYAPVAPGADGEERSAIESAGAAAEPQALPRGHFEAADANALREGYWSERIYTIGLPAADAQLLTTALERGSVALSLGYAFLADGIGSDAPLQQISGSPALVAALKGALAPPVDTEPAAAAERPSVVRSGALGVTADLGRWPQLVERVDINDAAPPGYAALDVYCYDFNQRPDSPLYEKQIEIEADGMGGRPVTLMATFSRAHPDLYARSLRFPVAVRLDRPYRFRVLEIDRDGTSRTSPWREQPSWTELLDVTAQGGQR